MKNSDHDWINPLFKEIEFLTHSYNSEKERDCRITLSWMEKVHQHYEEPRFNHLTMSRFLDELSHIMERHPIIRISIIKYVKDHHIFRKDLLDKTYGLLLESQARELCHLLRGISFLEITDITEEWWSRWLSCSIGKMSKFNKIDTRQAIRSCARLNHTPTKEWCDAWEIKCKEHLNSFPIEPDSFSKILNAIGFLQINIDKSLLKEIIKNTRTYLSALSQKDLFLVSKSFALEEVCKEKQLVSDWFNLSYEHIGSAQKHELEALCVAFSFIGKLDEHISWKWISACIEKITTDFEFLSIKAISIALYAMALFQMETATVKPFLEKCRLLFKKERSKLFYESMTSFDFRHIMIASFYFKIKQFNFGLFIEDYPHLLEELKLRKAKPASEGEQLVLDTLDELSIHHVERELWINEIMDFLDFSISLGDSQKALEFDGRHHEVNGMTNRLTQLKTFILMNYGYELIRINYKDKKHMKNILLHELSFFEQGHTKQKNDDASKMNYEINTHAVFNLSLLYPSNAKNVSEETYKDWMASTCTLLQTCEILHFNKLLLQFSLLVENKGRVKHAFQRYAYKDEAFKTMVFERTLAQTEHYSSHELIELLHTFARLPLKPTNAWRDTWCDLSLKQMDTYNIYDFKSIFNYSNSVGISLNYLWVKEFFDHTLNSLDTINLAELYELAHCCAYHRLNIPKPWAQALNHRLLCLLNGTKDQNLFSLPSVFSIDVLRKNTELLLKWFEQTGSVMNNHEPMVLIEALYQLAKLDITAPDLWFAQFQKRIVEAFHLLDLKEITLMLYSLALLNRGSENTRPFLDVCQDYFIKRENTLILDKRNIDCAQKLLLAKNYFDMCGYQIMLRMKDENNLYETFFSENRQAHSPLIQEELGEYLRDKYFSDLTRHIRIDFLVKYVDFYSPEHKLIIDIESGRNLMKSRLIDSIIEGAGYSIIRLHSNDIKTCGYDYVDEAIKHHNEKEKNKKIKRHIFAKPTFVSDEKEPKSLDELSCSTNDSRMQPSEITSHVELSKPLRLAINSRKKKTLKKKKVMPVQRKLRRNVLTRVLEM